MVLRDSSNREGTDRATEQVCTLGEYRLGKPALVRPHKEGKCSRRYREFMLTSSHVDVSSPPHYGSKARLVACQMPIPRMDGARKHEYSHLFHSSYNYNEVWTSSSSWKEFALTSDLWPGLGCMP